MLSAGSMQVCMIKHGNDLGVGEANSPPASTAHHVYTALLDVCGSAQMDIKHVIYIIVLVEICKSRLSLFVLTPSR